MSEPDASETTDDQAEPDGTATDEQSAAGASADAADALDDLVDGTEVPDDVSIDELTDAADVSVDDELVERVTNADAEQVATEVAALRTKVASLETQLETSEAEKEDLESRLKRTQADFQNYKKRMKKRREEEKERATEDLVERLLDVRDNLVRALDQDEDADIRDGIEATLRQFDEELERENVTEVTPDPGDAVDPQRHEVLLRVESDQPEGTVAEVHRPGYEMGEKVIRTAQVTVSEGPDGQ
ncbi:nucleotide exchange factor GrpE [Halorientalis salina]|uniref:nucleotide exchange factor GrpE n=1 Tax=Halorientalis salina TaxID=2932266 RepID=UPI0010ACABE1|nr:nucleotide exchange factor GrpE [Halorientalis salina]